MLRVKKHWFKFVANGVVLLFFGIMAYVLVVAFTRTSGSTGLDMATIQKMRYDAQQQKQKPES